EELVARSDIPFGHKLAIREIPRGEEIIKYGEVIGRATRDIEIGEHVHVHNVESLRGRGDLKKE
ncbi:MAG: D-galactarate dehydratase, partial [Thaumarchaeota archaeon]